MKTGKGIFTDDVGEVVAVNGTNIIYKNYPTYPAIVSNEQIIFVDCDDTLVMWEDKNFDKKVTIVDPYDGKENILGIHEGHLKVLRDRKSRGAYIIVWSAGGYRWAKAVVEALGITQHVDQIMSKPFMYLDDKEAADIMGTRLFLGFDSKYGKDKR